MGTELDRSCVPLKTFLSMSKSSVPPVHMAAKRILTTGDSKLRYFIFWTASQNKFASIGMCDCKGGSLYIEGKGKVRNHLSLFPFVAAAGSDCSFQVASDFRLSSVLVTLCLRNLQTLVACRSLVFGKGNTSRLQRRPTKCSSMFPVLRNIKHHHFSALHASGKMLVACQMNNKSQIFCSQVDTVAETVPVAQQVLTCLQKENQGWWMSLMESFIT